MKKLLLLLFALNLLSVKAQTPNYFYQVKNTNAYTYIGYDLLLLSSGTRVASVEIMDGLAVLDQGGFVSYDVNGNLLWSKTIDNYYPKTIIENNNSIISLLSGSSNNRYIGKSSNTTGNFNWIKSIFVINANFNGAVQTVNLFKEGNLNSVFFNITDNSNVDYTFLTKIDANGNSIFSKRIDSLYLYSAQQYGTDYYLLGKSTWQTSDSIYYFLKYDSNLNLIWSKSFSYPQSTYAYLSTPDAGGVYVLGNGVGGYMTISSFDHNGNEHWSRQFYADNIDITSIYPVDVFRKGGYSYLSTQFFDGTNYVTKQGMVKLDNSGNFMRSRLKSFNYSIYDQAYAMNPGDSIYSIMGAIDNDPGGNYGMCISQHDIAGDLETCFLDSIGLIDSGLVLNYLTAPAFTVANEAIMLNSQTISNLTETPYLESVNTHIDSLSLVLPMCSPVCNGEITVHYSGYDQNPTIVWSANAMGQVGSYINGICAGTYTVQQTDVMGCIDSASVSVSNAPPLTPEICMVTVNATSQYNMIFWDKSGYANSDTFLVYRDTANNNYALIGAVPYDSLSVFNDTVRSLYSANGDPNVSSWRYKIAVIDSCGTMSAMSPYHQTIFMQDNGTGDFIWNHYQIEGQPIPVPALSGYACLRDDFSNDNWATVVTLSASSTAFTDPNFSSFPTGSWRNKTVWSIGCSDSTGRYSGNNEIMGAINTSRSNIKSPTSIGIKETAVGADFAISPNPATETIFVKSGGKNIVIELFNVLGQKVLDTKGTEGVTKLDVSTIEAGVYYLKVTTEKGSAAKQVIIE